MSIQWKSTVIIISTLVIGILIGVFLAGPVMHRHLRPPISERGPDGFASMLERIIQPTPDQEEAVGAVLAMHSARLDGMRAGFRDEMVALMDSLRVDLDPILTDEQKARLDDRHGHLKRLFHGKPDSRGRPPRPDGRGPGG